MGVKVRLTVDEVTEYIWIKPIGFEPHFVHGTLANDPVDLGDLKIDDQVELPIEDVCDWGYLQNGEPVGFYSVKAIQQIRSEQKRD